MGEGERERKGGEGRGEVREEREIWKGRGERKGRERRTGAQKWEFIQGNQPLRRLAGYIYIYIHRQQHTLVLVQANPKP